MTYFLGVYLTSEATAEAATAATAATATTGAERSFCAFLCRSYDGSSLATDISETAGTSKYLSCAWEECEKLIR